MNRRWTTPWTIACLLFAVLLQTGCGSMGLKKEIDVDAQYRDLKNRSVVVLVSMPDHVRFNHPTARQEITTQISRRIITGVPSAKVTDPQAVIAWQDKDENRYWATRPPSAMLEHFGVDRLVLVGVGKFRMHEPGDKYILRGLISATINIYEAEATDPDNPGAAFSKDVMYPEARKSKIGEVGISEKRIEFMTVYRFCEETAGLFYDHVLVR